MNQSCEENDMRVKTLDPPPTLGTRARPRPKRESLIRTGRTMQFGSPTRILAFFKAFPNPSIAFPLAFALTPLPG